MSGLVATAHHLLNGNFKCFNTLIGGLKRTLRSLSAKSDRPREKEEDILHKLRSEGLLATDTQQAKSGLAFDLMQESSQPRKLPPARLAKLEKRQKRRKLLTQQDIEAKLAKAEQRRKVNTVYTRFRENPSHTSSIHKTASYSYISWFSNSCKSKS